MPPTNHPKLAGPQVARLSAAVKLAKTTRLGPKIDGHRQKIIKLRKWAIIFGCRVNTLSRLPSGLLNLPSCSKSVGRSGATMARSSML